MATLIAVGAVVIFIGVVLIALGLQMRGGNLDSLHSYHTRRVREEDRLAFGRKIGLGILVIGLGVVAFGATIIAERVTGKREVLMIGLAAMTFGLTAGMMLCVYALQKNK